MENSFTPAFKLDKNTFVLDLKSAVALIVATEFQSPIDKHGPDECEIINMAMLLKCRKILREIALCQLEMNDISNETDILKMFISSIPKSVYK
jgi:hypothetical protein